MEKYILYYGKEAERWAKEAPEELWEPTVETEIKFDLECQDADYILKHGVMYLGVF